MAANFSVQQVLDMVARNEEMDVGAEEIANEGVTLADGIGLVVEKHVCVKTARARLYCLPCGLNTNKRVLQA